MKMTMRKKTFLFIASAILIQFLFVFARNKFSFKDEPRPIGILENTATSDTINTPAFSLYDTLGLQQLGLSRLAYNYAVKGYNYLVANDKIKNQNLLSIVDFSQPSSKKRLYVIDLVNKKLLFNTYVSHGRNSGKDVATSFSNLAESNKSSLGFYVTGDTYIGKHGYSMRLLGEDKGFNDNANSRAIVMHSATYVSEAAIKMQGFIGRSLGCPALPMDCYKPIIEKIKKGSCLFLYSPDKYYAANSGIMRKIA